MYSPPVNAAKYRRDPVTENEFKDIFFSLDGFIPDSQPSEVPSVYAQASPLQSSQYSTYSASRKGTARSFKSLFALEPLLLSFKFADDFYECIH